MTVQINDAFFPDLGHSSSVRTLVHGIGENIAATARSASDDPEYSRGIVVQDDATQYRAVVHVVATAPESLAVESRTGILARAVAAHGR